jgi:hypothetical protein
MRGYDAELIVLNARWQIDLTGSSAATHQLVATLSL